MSHQIKYEDLKEHDSWSLLAAGKSIAGRHKRLLVGVIHSDTPKDSCHAIYRVLSGRFVSSEHIELSEAVDAYNAIGGTEE